MAQDSSLKPQPVPSGPPGLPVRQPAADTADPYALNDQIDKQYWVDCIEDAERAEQDWRRRGREIIQIYRNETRNARSGKWQAGTITFNILYANTEVMLPAVYQKPPEAVVGSPFTKRGKPPPRPPPPPPIHA